MPLFCGGKRRKRHERNDSLEGDSGVDFKGLGTTYPPTTTEPAREVNDDFIINTDQRGPGSTGSRDLEESSLTSACDDDVTAKIAPAWMDERDQVTLNASYSTMVATLERAMKQRNRERRVVFHSLNCRRALILYERITALSHSGICRIRDCRALSEDCVELVMEDIDGEWLLDYCCRIAREDAGVTERDVLSLVEQMVSVVQSLHSVDLVSLNISPHCFKVVGDRLVLCRLPLAMPVSETSMYTVNGGHTEQMWCLSPDLTEAILRAVGSSTATTEWSGRRRGSVATPTGCTASGSSSGAGSTTGVGIAGGWSGAALASVPPATESEIESRARSAQCSVECTGRQLKSLDIWQTGVLSYLMLTGTAIRAHENHLIKGHTRMSHSLKECLLDLLDPSFENRFFAFQTVTDYRCFQCFREFSSDLPESSKVRCGVGSIAGGRSGSGPSSNHYYGDSMEQSPKPRKSSKLSCGLIGKPSRIRVGVGSSAASRRRSVGDDASVASVYPSMHVSQTKMVDSMEVDEYIDNLKSLSQKYRDEEESRIARQTEAKEEAWSDMKQQLSLEPVPPSAKGTVGLEIDIEPAMMRAAQRGPFGGQRGSAGGTSEDTSITRLSSAHLTSVEHSSDFDSELVKGLDDCTPGTASMKPPHLMSSDSSAVAKDGQSQQTPLSNTQSESTVAVTAGASSAAILLKSSDDPSSTVVPSPLEKAALLVAPSSKRVGRAMSQPHTAPVSGGDLEVCSSAAMVATGPDPSERYLMVPLSLTATLLPQLSGAIPPPPPGPPPPILVPSSQMRLGPALMHDYSKRRHQSWVPKRGHGLTRVRRPLPAQNQARTPTRRGSEDSTSSSDGTGGPSASASRYIGTPSVIRRRPASVDVRGSEFRVDPTERSDRHRRRREEPSSTLDRRRKSRKKDRKGHHRRRHGDRKQRSRHYQSSSSECSSRRSFDRRREDDYDSDTDSEVIPV